MEILTKYIPKVEKRVLLLIAGIIWCFAGFRVFTLGLEDVHSSRGNWIVNLAFVAITFYVFFKFIFMKLVKKHTLRIINSEFEKQYIYSFFDLKSYFIMFFMMIIGISVRSLWIFNFYYIGTFYMGLGFALFSAGILFLSNSLNFEITKMKYSN
ncbi:hypothetical protein [Clostridium sp. CCUG 7971]|uniref:hypothetical protein n=1 Tax=Clostridium sp. CCUG 7971 TaxID=2811414 RepID=UPI001ABBC980|nr:hypothetical protein [Clostridium sp. CCUG 7971]MBO3445762.1 hypothetical protein [Clostridium sp. CCUG 7971]